MPTLRQFFCCSLQRRQCLLGKAYHLNEYIVCCYNNNKELNEILSAGLVLLTVGRQSNVPIFEMKNATTNAHTHTPPIPYTSVSLRTYCSSRVLKPTNYFLSCAFADFLFFFLIPFFFFCFLALLKCRSSFSKLLYFVTAVLRRFLVQLIIIKPKC